MIKLYNAIDKMIEALNLYKEGLKDLDQLFFSATSTAMSVNEVTSNMLKEIDINSDDFEELKKILETDAWPVAANPNLICDTNNHEEKLDRGRGIVDMMIEENLEGLRFLDYGCGEGHTSYIAADDKPIISVGYDLTNQNWEKLHPQKSNNYLTTDFNEVASRGPYNIVLALDVLDHSDSTMEQMLQQINQVLTNDGFLYVRCHPFTSRHGVHNYYGLNKAFVHLVFTQEELEKMNMKIVKNRGIVFPLATYKKAFEDTGFEILDERVIKEQVEPFFKTPNIAKRISRITGHSQFPEFQMQQSWVDYKLKKK